MGSVLIYAIYLFSEVLSTALLLRALFSWFARDPYSTVGKIYSVLIRFTEPVVAPCRQLLSRFNTGMIDFSVLLALLLIQVLCNIAVRIVAMVML